MATGPTVRRRRLGTELRRLRESTGYKLEEVAGLLGVAPSTLSRIETGKAPTKSAYLTQLLEMYQVTDSGQRQTLVDMAREGHRKGWWAAYDDVLPSGLGVYVGLEAEASGLSSYENSVVHGLLQTADYARAILRETGPRHSAEQIERLVDLRLERQRRLVEEPAIELWVILDEAVIKRIVGGPTVMGRQFGRLLATAATPEVTLQVLPFESGAHAGLDGPFSIIEFDERGDSEVVYVESAAGPLYLEKDRDVRARAEIFDRLRAAALPPAASLDLISAAARELALAGAGPRRMRPARSGRAHRTIGGNRNGNRSRRSALVQEQRQCLRGVRGGGAHARRRCRGPRLQEPRPGAARLHQARMGSVPRRRQERRIRPAGRLAGFAGLRVLGRGDEGGPLRRREQQRRARGVPRVPHGHAAVAENRHLHAVASRGAAVGALHPAGGGRLVALVNHRARPPAP
jgi:transcriptional regulator with XRE-family HTH domain